MPPILVVSFLRDRAALKRIATITAACAVIAAVCALLAPKWYRSVLTVVPAKQQKGSGIASLLGADLGGLAAGLDGASGGADAPRITAVLQSIAVTDAVIEKFDLRSRYREKYQENARTALWSHCGVKTLPKPNLVQLSCEDKDPRFVQQMLEYYAEYGNQVFRRVGVSSASEEVRFLEKRVSELRQQADEVAARMRDFQEKYQIVDLDTQSKAVVSALAALQSQRVSKQLELEYARSYSAYDESTLRQLESQLSVLDRKLHDMEQRSPEPSEKRMPRNRGAGGLFPAALDVPKLRSDYEKLFRDRKVSEASLVFALERLEAAKAAEARDVSTFLILDPPALPTRHSWPKRSQWVAIGLALGLLVGLGLEWLRTVGGPRALVAQAFRPPDSSR
jgi:tyrosine-protein kinase Etk/Wzc